jgi:hypothetical protein
MLFSANQYADRVLDKINYFKTCADIIPKTTQTVRYFCRLSQTGSCVRVLVVTLAS